MIKTERLPIILFAMFCLVCGLWSGLQRIGWNIALSPMVAHHGAIMVGGFLGTLIALEKIIPLRKRILFLIPVLNAVSVAFFFADQIKVSIYLLILSSASLVLVFLYYFRSQRSIIYVLMSLGAVCWLVGNVLLLSSFFYPLAFPWWVAFALYIIAAERMEIMKFLPVSSTAKQFFIGLLFIFGIGVVLSFHGVGRMVSAVSLIAIAAWLMKHDTITLNLKRKRLPQFTAITLLCGYIALLLTGIFFWSLSDQWLAYDAIVHAFFLGFVFSMIFAHGPMILPGIMGLYGTPFSKVLYVWLVILQSSWVLRVISDIYMAMEIRRVCGMLSAIAIVGYFVTMAILTFSSRQHAKVR
ncbi:hypothetical protein [Pseudochryseolinea flava]|uniref:NnrS family protein n=1 Tax=Pseudochryseolinea flava TaxID=2059302 RepID=A0A364Y8K2_9BACT|nr:hypothetical protein [Pseudochryseolinea flava]RAW02562.1 hypothetical protein DQQ10_00130 [Pseudochryseolinea flava]